MRHSICSYSFFFNDTATTEIYTLSLHDALPISNNAVQHGQAQHITITLAVLPEGFTLMVHDDGVGFPAVETAWHGMGLHCWRSEEHTSELRSQSNLVCRLLLEKKKQVKASLSAD